MIVHIIIHVHVRTPRSHYVSSCDFSLFMEVFKEEGYESTCSKCVSVGTRSWEIDALYRTTYIHPCTCMLCTSIHSCL